MTDILEPSKKIQNLRLRLYGIKDRRIINQELKEIRAQCIALEIQVNNLMVENRALVHEANTGLPDEEVAF